MDNWYIISRLAEIHRKELLSEADAYRRIHQNDPYRWPVLPRFPRLLAGLGDRLVAWGCWLQTRYAAPAASFTPQTASFTENTPCTS